MSTATCTACGAELGAGAEACFRCGRGATAVLQGSVVAARYEILARIGAGGMGTVYKAHDRTIDDIVALKVLRQDVADDPDLVRRFRGELKLARRITHRNVCRIHDYGEDGALRFISMEFVDGIDLLQEIKRNGAPALSEAFSIAIDVAHGLQAIHDEGIIHRDVKTANIMRDRRGQVRLMDFGIAKQRGDATVASQLIGTPEYMSPERIRCEPVDFRSDIYALGVVAYELFAGHVPFRGDSPWSTLQKHLDEPVDVERLPARPLPTAVVPILRKALSKRPDARFRTAREVAQAFHAAAGDPTFGALAPTRNLHLPTGRRRPARPSRTVLLFAVVAIVGIVAMTVLFVRRGARDRVITAEPQPAASISTLPAPEPEYSPSAPQQMPSAASPAQYTVRARAANKPERAALPEATDATPDPPTLPADADLGLPSTMAAATAGADVNTRQEGVLSVPGLLQVGARPWAAVSVDDRSLGVTPMAPVSLAPGTHTIRLSHPNYQTVITSVEIRAGDTTKLQVELVREQEAR